MKADFRGAWNRAVTVKYSSILVNAMSKLSRQQKSRNQY